MNPEIKDKLQNEHLSIGECIFTCRKMLINTVLGSCVSVTFYHASSNYAGMFHAMLPDAGMSGRKDFPCNFADVAIHSLLARFKYFKVPAHELDVKLFGGANTMCSGEDAGINEMLDVGLKNVQSARAVLKEYGLVPVREDVLGSSGRKLVFNTSTGDVWMKYL
jgi:chemotaxis protein CheD